jgi:hypothetical protein
MQLTGTHIFTVLENLNSFPLLNRQPLSGVWPPIHTIHNQQRIRNLLASQQCVIWPGKCPNFCYLQCDRIYSRPRLSVCSVSFYFQSYNLSCTTVHNKSRHAIFCDCNGSEYGSTENIRPRDRFQCAIFTTLWRCSLHCEWVFWSSLSTDGSHCMYSKHVCCIGV